jgi:protein-tyrosine phosphatase
VVRICFVCLGNICRSPIAEAVMRRLVADEGWTEVTVDSAGTGDWHLGEPPDPRTRDTLQRRGLAIDHVAQRFGAADLARFDLVIAMDRNNLRDLRAMATTEEERAKVRLLRSFDPQASAPDVPDPYYGKPSDFELVLEVCEAACRGLLEHVRGLR